MKEEVQAIVREMLSSFSNDVVPQHTHNGVDCNRIPIQNILIVPGIGLPLTSGANGYNLYIDPVDFTLELLPNKSTAGTPNANFDIGETGTPFYDVSINTTDEFQSNVLGSGGSNQFSQITGVTNNAVSDGTNNSTEQLTPNIKRFTSTDTTFQIEVGSAYVPTSTGTAAGGTVGIGTIDIKINGTVYHVLHT